MIVLVNLAIQLARNSYGLTLPFMRDSLDLSYAQAGSLIMAGGILGMIASFIFGMLAPRYGTRLIVGISAIVSGVGMIFLGASHSFPFALAMSGVVGFAAQGSTTPVMALLSVWFESRNRGTVAGLAAGGGGVSFIIVGALVPWLTGRDSVDGWRHTWYVMAVIVIAIGVVSLAFLKDAPVGPAGARGRKGVWPMAAYRSRLVWLMTALAFCSGWCVGLYTTFFGSRLQDNGVGLDVAGLLWGLLGFLGIVSGVLWGHVSDRLGRRSGFLFSFAGFGIGFLFFWLMPVLAGFVVSVVLVGLCFRAAYTICAAAAGDYVAPQISPAAFGLMGMGAGLGNAVGPVIGGRIADATSELAWVFAMAAGGAMVAVLASVFLRPPQVNRLSHGGEAPLYRDPRTGGGPTAA